MNKETQDLINGVGRHETGCPKSHHDLITGDPVYQCGECGCTYNDEFDALRCCALEED